MQPRLNAAKHHVTLEQVIAERLDSHGQLEYGCQCYDDRGNTWSEWLPSTSLHEGSQKRRRSTAVLASWINRQQPRTLTYKHNKPNPEGKGSVGLTDE